MLIHYLSTVTLNSILLNFTSYEFLQSFQDRADSHDIAWVFGMVQHQSLGHIQCCASSVVHYRTSSPPHRTPRGTSARVGKVEWKIHCAIRWTTLDVTHYLESY